MRLPPDIPTEVAASLAPKEWDVYRLAYGSALAEGDSQPGAAARASAAVGALRVLAAGGAAIVLKYDLHKHRPGGHEHDQQTHGRRRESGDTEWFHGAGSELSALRADQPFFLTSDADMAEGYARRAMSVGQRNKDPQLYSYSIVPGRTLVLEDPDPDSIDEAIEHAKANGYRYVEFTHPAFEVGDREYTTLAVLYPHEDLRLKSWETLSRRRAEKRFNPNQPRRPRGDPEGGQWTEGTAAAALTEAAEDRASWPAHIRAIKVPPAWTDVRYSDDPRADLLAVGRDAKGRPQYVYSARFAEKRAALKFARIRELDDKFEAIEAQNRENQRSDDSEVREHADALALIMETGLRPGSDRDLRATARAYGATTLEGRHVVRAGRETRLKFVGKKGADLDVPVKDKRVASMLRERARHAGAKGRLFPRTSDTSLREYAATLDGGGFRPKDFRTHLGTTIAASEVAKLPAPRSAAAYKRAVRGVAKKVAEVLGNTPTVALQSYIDPFVFSRLRAAAGA